MPLQLCDEFVRRKGGIFSESRQYEVHDLVGELVPTFRSTLFGHQPDESFVLKLLLRLIERGARKAERLRGARRGVLFHLDPAKHLVLDLDEVFRVEELELFEQRVVNAVGMSMAATAILETA